MRSFFVGLILIIFSIYPLYFMVQEIGLELYLNSKFKIDTVPVTLHPLRISEYKGVIASSYANKHNIEFLAEDIEHTPAKTEKESRIMNVTIGLDGKEISIPVKQELVVYDSKDTHFSAWNQIYSVETTGNEHEIAIVQRLTGAEMIENQKWRVSYIKGNGQMYEEVFSYSDRGKHLLGVELLRHSQTPIGFKSDILMTYPNIIFPILYPIMTFLLGILILIIKGIHSQVFTH